MTIQSAREVLKEIFGKVTSTSFAARLWDGSTVSLGASGEPVFTLVFNNEQVFADLVRTQNKFKFMVAYVNGHFDIEGDMYTAIRLKDILKEADPSWLNKLKVLWKLGLTGLHTKEHDMKNVQAHYDISNEVYKRFLDKHWMVYSCAYFHSEDESLEDAQEHKLDLICRKLRLKEGESLLDIGCGWGGLVIYAAQKYGVKAHGLTLAKNQYEYASQKVRELGLEDRITIELKDYRDLTGVAYDKIASIGMFEHVGMSHHGNYFDRCRDLLKEGGLFLNHTITTKKDPEFTSERKFMFTYIFPSAELDNVGNTTDVMESHGWEILNIECLRPHYARTLREWSERFNAREEEIKEFIPDQIRRAWKLYLAGLSLAFRKGDISICQTLASKTNKAEANVPLTMHDVYCGS